MKVLIIEDEKALIRKHFCLPEFGALYLRNSFGFQNGYGEDQPL